ncbi:tetratricopeptide repeat protein [Streptomyces sp. NPDC048057]|uniref:ATP-binding protein n=1 Tax=Streptomyces sp. NPDC048057 TaxID=3155628 RepID=UPI0033C32A5F
MTESREVVESSLSGTARDVVQARDVRGGIHYHHAPANVTTRLPVPYQLPMPSRGFVNRSAEREALDRLLDDGSAGVRVLLVTGTAGVGKTSLALHWAHAVREHFPDGQLYADLHGYGPQAPVPYERVLEGFLRALGAPADTVHTVGEHMAAAFRSCLAGRRLLVVLDNAASASQVRPLLPATPDCLAVVTSRRRLPGLAIREGARRLQLGVLDQEDSVALLRSVTSGYRDDDDTAHMAELATLCACLPLALRVAAERAAGRPLMHLVDLLDELRDESGRWEVLSAEDDEDSEAVRPVFAWSYRDVPPAAARLFRLLGLHPGPDFSDTAAAALAAVDVRTARRLLDVLIAAHMVEQTASDRFSLHDLLCAYAADQARLEQTAQERQDALRRVLTWYLHAADAVQASVAPQEPGWNWCPPMKGCPRRRGLQGPRRSPRRGQRPSAPRRRRTRRRRRGRLFGARRAGVAIATGIRSEAAEGYWLLALGDAQRATGRPAEALASYERAAALQERLGDRARPAAAWDGQGRTHLQLGRVQEAVDCHRRSVDAHRELGQSWGTAGALLHLADALDRAGAAQEATGAREDAAELLASFTDPRAARLREGIAARR